MTDPWSSEHRAAVINSAVTEAWQKWNTVEADPWEQLERSRRWTVALEQRSEEARRLAIGLQSMSLYETHPKVCDALNRIAALLSEPLEVKQPTRDAPLSSPAAAGRQTVAAGDPTGLGPCI